MAAGGPGPESAAGGRLFSVAGCMFPRGDWAYRCLMRPSRPPLVDVVIAAAFVVMVVVEALVSSAVRSPVLHVTVAGLAMAGLAWRRMFPVAVAALVIVANLVVNPEGQFSTLLALVLVAYTNGLENERRSAYLGLAVLVVPFLGALALEGLEPSDLAAALVFLVGPWSIGVAMRQRALRTVQAE